MRILVNAGPTREYIDTVRFLSNASSGRMGFAIARRAAGEGHHVVLVSGPVTLPPPEGVEFLSVVSAAEMLDACRDAFQRCDAAVLAAAVCDYRPAEPSPRKLKKTGSSRTLHLEPTADIAAELGAHKAHRLIVGFALEDHQAHARAQAKLERKRFDAIVLNAPASLAADRTTIEILTAGGGWSAPITGTKDDLAAAVIELVNRLHAAK